MSEMIERVAREIGSNMPCDAYSPHFPVPCNTFSCKCYDLAKLAIDVIAAEARRMHAENTDWDGWDSGYRAALRKLIETLTGEDIDPS